jgi:PTH1 family peptidyl-tRNA hydrolase
MWAIVGLGNPGIRYRWSRHNIGFYVINLLAEIHGIRLKRDRLIPALTGKGVVGGENVLLLKPTTYMNRSGIAVKGLSQLYGLSPQKILVISDDIDLPWNRIRIRKHGSSAGHKGVESIIKELGTTNFPRLRMGVGRPYNSSRDVVGHVLGGFGTQEKKELKDYCKKAVDAICTILNSDIDTAMNRFN